jgi:chloramphenicol 3-O-phosphotransferase
MSMIVILRGPCSVGKTATAYALAELMPDSAYLQGDGWPWLSDRTLATLRERSMREGGRFFNSWLAASAGVIVEHGLHAIVDWMFTKDADLRDLLGRLDGLAQPVHVFNLRVDPEEHLRRDAGRPAEERIGEGGVTYFQTEDESGDSTLGSAIDTTRLSPKEVAAAILRQVGENGSAIGADLQAS